MKAKIALIVFLLFLFCSYFVKPAFAQTIKINEFLAHPSSGNKEWVEFYNPEHLGVSDYWLDDDMDFNTDTGTSAKKSLSNINTDNLSYPYLEFSSFLNNEGDYIVLFSPLGEMLDHYQYQKDPGLDVAMGRFPDGSDNWVVLETATKGEPNGSPKLTPTAEPTNTPTPTPTPTSPKTPTPVPTSKVTSTPTSKSTSLPTSPSTEQSAGESGKADLPLEILGENIAASSTPTATKKISGNPSATPASKVLGGRESNLSKVLIGLGVILLVSCGILAFYKRQKNGNIHQ